MREHRSGRLANSLFRLDVIKVPLKPWRSRSGDGRARLTGITGTATGGAGAGRGDVARAPVRHPVRRAHAIATTSRRIPR
jgi:hypothetical protein